MFTRSSRPPSTPSSPKPRVLIALLLPVVEVLLPANPYNDPRHRPATRHTTTVRLSWLPAKRRRRRPALSCNLQSCRPEPLFFQHTLTCRWRSVGQSSASALSQAVFLASHQASHNPTFFFSTRFMRITVHRLSAFWRHPVFLFPFTFSFFVSFSVSHLPPPKCLVCWIPRTKF